MFLLTFIKSLNRSLTKFSVSQINLELVSISKNLEFEFLRFHYTVKPRKFKLRFSGYSVFGNEFGAHWIQIRGLIYELF